MVLIICIYFLVFINVHQLTKSYRVSGKFNRKTSQGLYSNPKRKPNLKNVDMYIAMKELQKLKSEGLTYKDAKLNSNVNVSTDGYKKLVGRKGTLDQRLRAVIAYKRSNSMVSSVPGDITEEEDQELENLMESDEFDYELEEDDEDAIYEKLITEVLQESKLSEMQKNFEIEQNSRQNDISNSNIEESNSQRVVNNQSYASPYFNSSAYKTNYVYSEIKTYTPTKSGSWGVFERPADISRAYGGGRTISKDEMKKMDEEFERREMEEVFKKREFLTGALKIENENERKIKSAINECRTYMRFGDRSSAVRVMENVRSFLSFQTELGGEAYLELGMALETVDRSEEARKIYGQLVTSSNSDKNRRNALQLLQGLEITMKLRKRGPQTVKPIVDYASLQSMSNILSQGLTNEWNDYKKKDISVSPWLGLDDAQKDDDLFKVNALSDAYYIFLRALIPLKFEKIPTDVIRKAFRKIFLSSDSEKMNFIRTKLTHLVADIPMREEPIPSFNLLSQQASDSSSSSSSSSSQESDDSNKQSNFRGESMKPPSPSSTLPKKTSLASMFEDNDYEARPFSSSKSRTVHTPSLSNIFEYNLNGSWELTVSMFDRSPSTLKRYEIGDIRRTIDYDYNVTHMDRLLVNRPTTAVESIPTMWGMSRSFLSSTIEWNTKLKELKFSYEDSNKFSQSPWQMKSKTQIVQILWVDKDIMVTRQPSDKLSSPDLYTLWKRMKPVIYNKY